MKVTCGNTEAEVYPVEPFVYEVVTKHKKEFYQSAWDAFNSCLYRDNVEAEIIKIPVVPMTDGEIASEISFFEMGLKMPSPSPVKEFKNTKPKKKIPFIEVVGPLVFVMWIVVITIFSIVILN